MSLYYILDDEHRPVPVDDIVTAASWWENNRQVAFDTVDDLEISTVFLMLNHRFWPKGPPILFETMVFRDGKEVECQRYASWDDAVTGHAVILRRCKAKAKAGAEAEK